MGCTALLLVLQLVAGPTTLHPLTPFALLLSGQHAQQGLAMANLYMQYFPAPAGAEVEKIEKSAAEIGPGARPGGGQ